MYYFETNPDSDFRQSLVQILYLFFSFCVSGCLVTSSQTEVETEQPDGNNGNETPQPDMLPEAAQSEPSKETLSKGIKFSFINSHYLYIYASVCVSLSNSTLLFLRPQTSQKKVGRRRGPCC